MTFYEWLYELDNTIDWDNYDTIEELEEVVVKAIKQKGKLNLKAIYYAYGCNGDPGITLSGEL